MSLAQDIKQLRQKTGAGMLDCRKALQENNGDMEQAITYLRKKGLADMAKISGRETNEGRVVIKSTADTTAMSFLGCETDFVAKTPEFIKLAEDVATLVSENADEDKIKTLITEVAPKLGENVTLKQKEAWKKAEGCAVVGSYIHSDNKKAAMVEIVCGKENCGNTDKMQTLAKELSLQAVGMIASWLEEKDVPKDVLEKEQEVFTAQAKNEGKPDMAIEKMMPGKLKKFCKENCLMEQQYIKDSKLSVKDYFEAQAKEIGCELKVTRFARF
ncbi:MAG: translation elongation factor Ts [Elusimicrobiaceae bacterium]|nr:translation elongation factor Ts [Elusimicrobiaceae bacterium]